MYETSPAPIASPLKAPWRRAWSRVSANVWLLGVTSLLTDVSSEMVTAVLPV
jgi:hypothetical protein